jgi:hypothetical protein
VPAVTIYEAGSVFCAERPAFIVNSTDLEALDAFRADEQGVLGQRVVNFELVSEVLLPTELTNLLRLF